MSAAPVLHDRRDGNVKEKLKGRHYSQQWTNVYVSHLQNSIAAFPPQSFFSVAKAATCFLSDSSCSFLLQSVILLFVWVHHCIQSLCLLSRRIGKEILPWGDHYTRLCSATKTFLTITTYRHDVIWEYEELEAAGQCRGLQWWSSSVVAGAQPRPVCFCAERLSSSPDPTEPDPAHLPRPSRSWGRFHESSGPILPEHSPA